MFSRVWHFFPHVLDLALAYFFHFVYILSERFLHPQCSALEIGILAMLNSAELCQTSPVDGLPTAAKTKTAYHQESSSYTYPRDSDRMRM